MGQDPGLVQHAGRQRGRRARAERLGRVAARRCEEGLHRNDRRHRRHDVGRFHGGPVRALTGELRHTRSADFYVPLDHRHQGKGESDRGLSAHRAFRTGRLHRQRRRHRQLRDGLSGAQHRDRRPSLPALPVPGLRRRVPAHRRRRRHDERDRRAISKSPRRPTGSELDLDKVAVNYKPGDNTDPIEFGQAVTSADCQENAFYIETGRIYLCEEACAALQKTRSPRWTCSSLVRARSFRPVDPVGRTFGHERISAARTGQTGRIPSISANVRGCCYSGKYESFRAAPW